MSSSSFTTTCNVQVKEHPNNYDAWFDYVRLCESDLTVDATREIYERAVAVVPPAPEKRLWRRYIYLWIYYAIFEELVAEVCSVPSLSISYLEYVLLL